jgi:Helix-turn-helix domain
MNEKKATSAKEAALISIREQIKGNDSKTQCKRLLEALARFSINTFEASRYLDVYYAPARVMSLRNQGYDIMTYWETVETEAGAKHRVGRYELRLGGEREAA